MANTMKAAVVHKFGEPLSIEMAVMPSIWWHRLTM